MSKSYKKKKGFDLYRALGITIIVLFVLVISSLIISKTTESNSPYTAEQLQHDHDGDGIPEH